MEAAIEATGLSVALTVPDLATWSLKEFILHGLRRGISHQRFWPLRDVSFVVEPGDLLGVIGRNGAGKTTLLRAVSGILPPAEGRVRVRGRITPVLSLGAGFHTDLTGRENIELLGALLGRTPQDMRARTSAIAEWAEVSGHLDIPLRAYSTGMAARLAFSVVTDAHTDVLLVDETFAVGDLDFQRRSFERIREVRAHGTTVVLVSHDLDVIEAWSSRVLWLDAGKVVEVGDPTGVVAAYRDAMAAHG